MSEVISRINTLIGSGGRIGRCERMLSRSGPGESLSQSPNAQETALDHPKMPRATLVRVTMGANFDWFVQAPDIEF